MKTKIYRIYSLVNSADTCRDTDDMHITQLCYKKGEEATIDYCKQYIKEHFFKKDTVVYVTKKGFEAVDFCSYGTVLIAELLSIY